ncbi:hypothetical protein XI38_03695 [Microbacterium aurantiacum]|uniref:Uncharacterized protein n=1 Tax=Microbacterium aurantiacum TaxID=162393 RepID=A0A0M8MQM0_9MICO|nr:hypothetical protein XI38_03695 [Microbacterium chocolatum]
MRRCRCAAARRSCSPCCARGSCRRSTRSRGSSPGWPTCRPAPGSGRMPTRRGNPRARSASRSSTPWYRHPVPAWCTTASADPPPPASRVELLRFAPQSARSARSGANQPGSEELGTPRRHPRGRPWARASTRAPVPNSSDPRPHRPKHPDPGLTRTDQRS